MNSRVYVALLATTLFFVLVLTTIASSLVDAVPRKKSEVSQQKSSGKNKNNNKKDADSKSKKSDSTKSKSTTGGGVGPDGKKYHEIVDLFLDYGRRYCEKLGPLIERPKGYSWKRRCDVYYEAIELFITAFSDTMVNELDLTQQEMVDEALKPMRLLELKPALKAVAKRALEAERADEKKLQAALNTKLSQWVMNTAVKKDNGMMGGGAGGSLSAEAIQAMLRNKGGLGGNNKNKKGGKQVVDEFAVTPEDMEWAEEVSADDYVDDPRKDDPDFLMKQRGAAGGGGGGDL